MDLVRSFLPFCFNYVDYAQGTGLFIRAKVYDVTSGVPSFVQNVVMPSVSTGLYSGNFTGAVGKTYLVIGVVYTDGTYVTADLTRSATARCFQIMGSSVLNLAFAWTAFDQASALPVAYSVYDCTTGSAVFVGKAAMTHVSNGVYFASFTGVVTHTYEILSSAYTDGTFVTPDPAYAPSGDGFLCNPLIQNQFVAATLNDLDSERITFTQGDTAILNLIATDGEGNAIDLTGAVFTTFIRAPNGHAPEYISFPNAQHTLLDQVLTTGQFTLSLGTSDTNGCGLGPNKEIMVAVVQGGTTTYYRGPNVLTVLAPVPSQ